MTDQTHQTDTPDAASKDPTPGQDRLAWTQPTLARNGIDAVTRGGVLVNTPKSEDAVYRPS